MNKGSFSVNISDILDQYDEEVKDKTKKIMREVAKEAVSKLQSSSPKKTGSYARGWKSKKDGDNTFVVYNATDAPLTHLLENGHVVRNQHGTYGRVRPIKHIQPVEEWANDEVASRIEREL